MVVPWRWSSGHRSCLLPQQSEFKSPWQLKFSVRKNKNKQKRGQIFKNLKIWNPKSTNKTSFLTEMGFHVNRSNIYASNSFRRKESIFSLRQIFRQQRVPRQQSWTKTCVTRPTSHHWLVQHTRTGVGQGSGLKLGSHY